MALISKTRTYDTFLANTGRRALHDPHPDDIADETGRQAVRTVPGRARFPDRAEVRKQGTLLLGIDKDTQSAYLYAVGHANGTATVIQGLGKVPGTFNDPGIPLGDRNQDPLVGE